MSPYLSVILDNLLPAIGGLVAVVVSVLVTKVIRIFEAKVGIDLSTEHEQKFEDALIRAVSHAEEWAHGKLAAGESKPAGAEKLEQALKFLKAEVARLNLDVTAEETLKAHLQARLGLTR